MENMRKKDKTTLCRMLPDNIVFHKYLRFSYEKSGFSVENHLPSLDQDFPFLTKQGGEDPKTPRKRNASGDGRVCAVYEAGFMVLHGTQLLPCFPYIRLR